MSSGRIHIEEERLRRAQKRSVLQSKRISPLTIVFDVYMLYFTPVRGAPNIISCDWRTLASVVCSLKCLATRLEWVLVSRIRIKFIAASRRANRRWGTMHANRNEWIVNLFFVRFPSGMCGLQLCVELVENARVCLCVCS